MPCFNFVLSTLDLQPTTYRGPEEALTMTMIRHVSSAIERCLYTWRQASSILIHTPLLIKLFKDFSYDLPDAL